MRSNQNPQVSTERPVSGKLTMPAMPLEWLDAGSWRLPSGKALAEFALQAGFLAPLLFQSERFGSGRAEPANKASLKARALRTPAKNFGRGNGQ